MQVKVFHNVRPDQLEAVLQDWIVLNPSRTIRFLAQSQYSGSVTFTLFYE